MDTREKDMALQPATLCYDTTLLHDPNEKYADESRIFQGIPGIECSVGGRFFTTFYTGEETEMNGNFVLVQKSEDGEHYEKSFMAVLPPENTRCFDPCLWRDPANRLWLFWAQSCTQYDGRIGVWAAVCQDPDADMVRFGEPRRIANGIMMNKPTILDNGEWLLPCSIWSSHTSDLNHLPKERYSNVYRSADNGETFTLWGHSEVPGRLIDENMLYQRKDGTVVMLVRTGYGIGEAFSKNGGKTWQGEGDSGLGGPCSRFCVRRLSSGRLLLVNHKNFKGRNNLTAMLSEDDGLTWNEGLLLDGRNDVSYPDMTEKDGYLYIIHDYNRYSDKEILMDKVTEADILAGKLVSEGSKMGIIVNKATGKRG